MTQTPTYLQPPLHPPLLLCLVAAGQTSWGQHQAGRSWGWSPCPPCQCHRRLLTSPGWWSPALVGNSTFLPEVWGWSKMEKRVPFLLAMTLVCLDFPLIPFSFFFLSSRGLGLEWVSKMKTGLPFLLATTFVCSDFALIPFKKNLICFSRSGDQMDRCTCCRWVQTDGVWRLWKLPQSLQMFGDEESKMTAWFHFCQWHLSFQISHCFHFFSLSYLA